MESKLPPTFDAPAWNVEATWERARPCKGTVAAKFLLFHQIDVYPGSIIRFLPGIYFRRFIAAPAVILPMRRWPDATIVALEAWPLSDDGLMSPRLDPEIWGGPDILGAAVQCGGAGSGSLALTSSGLDALRLFCALDEPCWGAIGFRLRDGIFLPPPPAARVVTVIDAEPPMPQVVRRWRTEDREIRFRQTYAEAG